MNNLSAIGNVGKDAELRFTQSGDAICQFSFALTSGYGDKAITTWLNCSLWGKRGETLAPMLLKGTKIGITGEFTARPYTTKEGAEKLSLDVRVNDLTLLGGKQEGGNGNTQRQDKKQNVQNIDDGDSIPF